MKRFTRSATRLSQSSLYHHRQQHRSLTTTSPLNASPADHVRIVEVGARDGLQNEKNPISVENKLELIRRLSQTGVTHIEAGSFVPAKWVPQMAATSEILADLIKNPPQATHGVAYNYLVPNIRGMENMIKIFEQEKHQEPGRAEDGYPTPPPSPGPGSSPDSQQAESTATTTTTKNTQEISLFAAATEAFSQRNTNCDIAESLRRSLPIISLAKARNIRVRGYVSVALGCPYEGPDVNPHKVAELTASLLEMGCDEVSVADTTGMGTVPKTRELLKVLQAAGVRMEDIALHFHDTYGQALVNTVVGLEAGVRVFDSSVGGLGGCPYSKGATGNLATEDLIHLVHSLGMQTGVDMVKMAETAEWIVGVVGKANEGRAGKATLARMRG